MKKRVISMILCLAMLFASVIIAGAENIPELNDLIEAAKTAKKAEVVIKNDVAVTKATAIPEGITVVVLSEGSLTLNSYLTIVGRLLVYGELVNNSYIINASTYPQHGQTGHLSVYDFVNDGWFCKGCNDFPCSCGNEFYVFSGVGLYAPFFNYFYGNGQYYNDGYYKCTFCGRYHLDNTACPYFYDGHYYPGNGFYYCKDCKAFHIYGAVCNTAVKPEKYYNCHKCGAYHLDGTKCTLSANPFSEFTLCETCKFYHLKGEACTATNTPAQYYFCPRCYGFHLKNVPCEYSGYGYTYLHTYFCNICSSNHIAGTPCPYNKYLMSQYDAEKLVVKKDSKDIFTKIGLFKNSTAPTTFGELCTSLSVIGLKATKKMFSNEFESDTKLTAQQSCYVIYTALLEAKEISRTDGADAIVKKLSNSSRIANINEYKEAIALFVSVGIIKDISFNPTGTISSEMIYDILLWAYKVI